MTICGCRYSARCTQAQAQAQAQAPHINQSCLFFCHTETIHINTKKFCKTKCSRDRVMCSHHSTLHTMVGIHHSLICHIQKCLDVNSEHFIQTPVPFQHITHHPFCTPQTSASNNLGKKHFLYTTVCTHFLRHM